MSEETSKRLNPAQVPIRDIIFTAQQKEDARARLNHLRRELSRCEQEERDAANRTNLARELLADEEDIAKRLGLFTVY